MTMTKETYTIEPTAYGPMAWEAPCPTCGVPVRAHTIQGVLRAMCDHMNAMHPLKKEGH